MTAHRLPRLLVTLLILGLAAACSSTGELKVTNPKTESIPPGKTVALSVTSAVTAPDEDTAEVMRRLRTELFGRLPAEGIFKYVLQESESADYKLDVKIQSAHEVSTGARIFLGVFAGSNKLALSNQLYDQATGKLVTSFNVSGESASHPLSTEAGLDDAVREAVDKVAAALR